MLSVHICLYNIEWIGFLKILEKYVKKTDWPTNCGEQFVCFIVDSLCALFWTVCVLYCWQFVWFIVDSLCALLWTVWIVAYFGVTGNGTEETDLLQI